MSLWRIYGQSFRNLGLFFMTRTVMMSVILGVGLGMVAPVAVVGNAWAQASPPPAVLNGVKDIKPMGNATYRWFGLRVYDIQLWSASPANEFNYKKDPYWLELKYARDFEGKEIAKKSIEEIEDQKVGTPAQHAKWLAQLESAFPDVSKGNTLSAYYQPGVGMQFFKDGKLLVEITDLELSVAFLGIWLDTKTSAPELRRQLIGLPK